MGFNPIDRSFEPNRLYFHDFPIAPFASAVKSVKFNLDIPLGIPVPQGLEQVIRANRKGRAYINGFAVHLMDMDFENVFHDRISLVLGYPPIPYLFPLSAGHCVLSIAFAEL